MGKRQVLVRTLFVVVVVFMMSVSGCAPATPAQTPVPSTPVPAQVTPTPAEKAEPTPTVVEVRTPITFIYAAYTIAETLDHHVRADNPTGLPSQGIYEGLVGYKLGAMEIEPRLATDWKISDDGLTYSFNLRQGVKFHNDTLFTSRDVKASFDRLMSLGIGAAFHLAPVSEVRIVDDYLIEVELKQPYSPFLGSLPWVRIYSAKAIEENSDKGEWGTEWFADNAVGTGPYKLESFRRGEEIILTKFEDYWGGWDHKHVDRYIFNLVPEGSTRVMLSKAGEAHLIDQVPIEDLPELEANPQLNVLENASIRMFYLKMNTVGGPTQDKAVRQAVALAFDRDTFCNDILEGHCDVPRGLLPSALPGHDPTIPEPEVDLEKAAQLLDDAGWIDTNGDGIRDKDGQPLKLILMYLGPYEWQRMGGELLQANLAEIGVKVELEGQPWSTMVERMKDPSARPEITFVAVYATSPSADTVFWPMFHTNSGHWSNFDYSDPTVDELLEEARRTIDDKERNAIYAKLDRFLLEEAPAVPAVVMTMIFVSQAEVGGYVFQPMDPFIPPLYNMYLER